MLLYYIAFLSCFYLVSSDESVKVKTKLGAIKGEVVKTPVGREVDAFRGIPFAKPPVGQLRFKKPKPVEPWSDTLIAQDWQSRCIFSAMIPPDILKTFPGKSSEDCLYLNIFVPHMKSDNFPNGYPVMFWIHGGGFMFGGTQEYGMEGIIKHMVTKDVIVVTIQYRLSVLGFFTTGDEAAPANIGYWDQTMALRWIKDNVGSFGGDPNLITVFGESAGGFSVSALSVSPHARDLFQYAIPMSGAILTNGLVMTKEIISYISKSLAQSVGCEGNSVEIVQCLRNVDPDQLEMANLGNMANGQLLPCIDGDFFPKDYESLFRESPKKPTMAGAMDCEGVMFTIPTIMPMPLPSMVWNISAFNYEQLTQMLDIVLMKYKNKELMKSLILHEYIHSKGDIEDRSFLLRKWADIVGDEMIENAVANENNRRFELGWPVWFYVFKHVNPTLLPDEIGFKCAMHGAEMAYLFELDNILPIKFTEDDYKMMNIATTLWTNFAKFGNESVTVNTKLGSIKGKVLTTSAGHHVDTFRGVPFAKAPVGDLRFEKSQPIEPWSDTLNAQEWKSRCFYSAVIPPNVSKTMFPGEKSEDCLYLNIFAPHSKSENFPNGYPVMFWIHGGGFTIGGAQEYGMKGIAEHLVTKDVIVVTIQYRLSVLGFFTTGDEAAPGNMGYWDQALALHWVKNHIGSFGGDPNLITAFGESAGGSSVSGLSVSPYTRELFQNAIPMSGAVLNNIQPTTKAKLSQYGKSFAQSVGCEGNSEEIVQCLRNVDPDQLEFANLEFMGKSGAFYSFIPFIDGDFFPKNYESLFRESPKKPTMAGVMDCEGLVFTFYKPFMVQNISAFNYEQLSQMLDFVLLKHKNKELMKILILHEYIDSKGDPEDKLFLMRKWAEIVGDEMLTAPVANENSLRLELDWPVWFYNFEYLNPTIHELGIKCAMHAGELAYLFEEQVFSPPFNFTENDYKMLDIATTLWTNFAKFGDPTPESVNDVKWERRTAEKPLQFLSIDLNLKMRSSYKRDMHAFWNKLVPKIQKLDIEPEEKVLPDSNKQTEL